VRITTVRRISVYTTLHVVKRVWIYPISVWIYQSPYYSTCLVYVIITCYLRRPKDVDKEQLPLADQNLG
jgi:hypothetical protein